MILKCCQGLLNFFPRMALRNKNGPPWGKICYFHMQLLTSTVQNMKPVWVQSAQCCLTPARPTAPRTQLRRAEGGAPLAVAVYSYLRWISWGLETWQEAFSIAPSPSRLWRGPCNSGNAPDTTGSSYCATGQPRWKESEKSTGKFSTEATWWRSFISLPPFAYSMGQDLQIITGPCLPHPSKQTLTTVLTTWLLSDLTLCAKGQVRT